MGTGYLKVEMEPLISDSVVCCCNGLLCMEGHGLMDELLFIHRRPGFDGRQYESGAVKV